HWIREDHMQLRFLIFFCLLSPFLLAQSPTAARVVAWEPKPGAEKDFADGYRRHLEWHRQNNDSWTWLGWDITSGDGTGYFVDGTFFRPWEDFDHPVAPAEDSADNRKNVYPYGNVRSVATYSVTPVAHRLREGALTAPFLAFVFFAVTPGNETAF